MNWLEIFFACLIVIQLAALNNTLNRINTKLGRMERGEKPPRIDVH